MKGSERSVTVLCVRLDMIYDFIVFCRLVSLTA